MRRAVVVGSGIGGVTAAVALQQVGWQVTVLERAETIGEVGAGLSIWPSAAAALRSLGVPGVTSDATVGAMGMRLVSGRWIIGTKGLGEKSPMMIHRAQLHDRITQQFGSAVTVRTGFRVTGLDQDAAGATVRGEDEALRADLVVAADGLRSTVRAALHPGHPGPRYSGYTSYRGIAEYESDDSGDETWGRGRRFGFARLVDGRIYWYGTSNQPERRRDTLDGVRSAFAGWHDPIPALLAATTTLLQHDLYDLALPLPPFASGRVALLGDAAHAMTPNLGRGACAAIEDAAALGRHVGSTPSVMAGLDAYDAERRPVTTKLVRTSRRIGQLGQIEGAALGGVRDGFLTAVGAVSSLGTRR